MLKATGLAVQRPSKADSAVIFSPVDEIVAGIGLLHHGEFNSFTLECRRVRFTVNKLSWLALGCTWYMGSQQAGVQMHV